MIPAESPARAAAVTAAILSVLSSTLLLVKRGREKPRQPAANVPAARCRSLLR